VIGRAFRKVWQSLQASIGGLQAPAIAAAAAAAGVLMGRLVSA
jgi:hypothetical protein